MSARTPEKLPEGWMSFEQFVEWTQKRVMANGRQGVEFVLNNWNCKYINARIDMRTGSVCIAPGAEE